MHSRQSISISTLLEWLPQPSHGGLGLSFVPATIPSKKPNFVGTSWLATAKSYGSYSPLAGLRWRCSNYLDGRSRPANLFCYREIEDVHTDPVAPVAAIRAESATQKEIHRLSWTREIRNVGGWTVDDLHITTSVFLTFLFLTFLRLLPSVARFYPMIR